MKRIFFLLSTAALLTLTTPGSASRSVPKNKTPIIHTTSIIPIPNTGRPVFRRSHYQEQQ